MTLAVLPHEILGEPPREGVVQADPSGRTAVYRNNHRVSLVRALEKTFPVTLQIVGAEFFGAMAAHFVAEHPPRSPILSRYGAAFPNFIGDFGPASELDYLPAVASVEWLRVDAYHSADAPQAPAEGFNDPEAILGCRIMRHPAARVLASVHPALSIWRAHQVAGEHLPISWSPERVLIARPQGQLSMFLLDDDQFAVWEGLNGLMQAGALLETITADMGEIHASNAFVELTKRGAVAFQKRSPS